MSKHPKPIKIALEFLPDADTLQAGFRINWMDGRGDEADVNLSCGAGCGSPYLIFSRTDKRTGKTRRALCDIRQIMEPLAKALSDK